MTSSLHHWHKLTDNDEILEIIEDINKQPLQFASTEGIQTHSDIAEQFVELVLGCESVFISDESRLYDFEFIDEVHILEEKIRTVFGVDVSDIEDKNLVKIFERINSSL